VGVIVALVVAVVVLIVVVVVLIIRRGRRRLATTTDRKLSFLDYNDLWARCTRIVCLLLSVRLYRLRCV